MPYIGLPISHNRTEQVDIPRQNYLAASPAVQSPVGGNLGRQPTGMSSVVMPYDAPNEIRRAGSTPDPSQVSRSISALHPSGGNTTGVYTRLSGGGNTIGGYPALGSGHSTGRNAIAPGVPGGGTPIQTNPDLNEISYGVPIGNSSNAQSSHRPQIRTIQVNAIPRTSSDSYIPPSLPPPPRSVVVRPSRTVESSN